MGMLTVSSRILKIFAALVWYIGGIRLLQKGIELLIEAESNRPRASMALGSRICGARSRRIESKILVHQQH